MGAVVFFASVVNLFVYAGIAVAIRGDALTGKIAGGRYYVNWKGDLTEVSRETYHYSYVHSLVTWTTAPVGVIGFLLMGLLGRQRPRSAARPRKREYVFMLLGSAIGLICGILLVVFVPRLLHSQALRTPWVAIPEGFLVGLVVGLLSAGIFCSKRGESQEPAAPHQGREQEQGGSA